MNHRRRSAYRFVTVLSSLALIVGVVFGTNVASSFAASKPSLTHFRGFVRISNEVLPQVQKATLLGRAGASSPMSLSIALPNQNQTGLDRLILNIERGTAKPISQEQFASQFGATKAQVNNVVGWARANGLRVTYVSIDGMTIGVTGATASVEHALQVRIDNFRLGGRTFYSTTSNPTLPARLGIQTIVGLNSFQRAHFVGLHPFATRNGGYFPRDFRAAYDVSQHGGSAARQTIGFTLWGAPENNADLAKFASVTGDTRLVTCAATTSVGTPASCSGAHSANTVQWVQLDGRSNDIGGLGETALDVESAHGLAPSSHLKYFLGGDGAGQAIADAVSAAANDKTLHLVSNSWGVNPVTSASNPFAIATTNSFKHAVAVGTTFFVSSGDSANDSGCPRQGSMAQTTCGGPSYPADNPYVVAVGGTNLQVNNNATAYSSESVWSNLQFGTSKNYNVSGGGTGCAKFYARPAFQKNVPGVTANATCAGRAEPDVSADADSFSGALVVHTAPDAHNHPVQVIEDIGGTSLAAPLWTAMAADSNNYLGSHGKKPVGFWAPQIYKLAQTKLYNTYFHDIVCGYNGVPASTGWDQATGWGSPDWFKLTEGLAGTPPAATGKRPTNCQIPASESVTAAENSLALPFKYWPNGTVAKTESAGRLNDSFVDTASKNYFRQFHSKSYASFGLKGGVGESANIKMGSDATPFGYYVATYYPNNNAAANMVKDVVMTVKKKYNVTYTDCSVNLESRFGLVQSLVPLTPDCQADIVSFGNGVDGILYIFAVNNTVGELLVQVKSATLNASPAGVLNDADVLANNQVVTLMAATNGFAESFPAPIHHRPMPNNLRLNLSRPSVHIAKAVDLSFNNR